MIWFSVLYCAGNIRQPADNPLDNRCHHHHVAFLGISHQGFEMTSTQGHIHLTERKRRDRLGSDWDPSNTPRAPSNWGGGHPDRDKHNRNSQYPPPWSSLAGLWSAGQFWLCKRSHHIGLFPYLAQGPPWPCCVCRTLCWCCRGHWVLELPKMMKLGRKWPEHWLWDFQWSCGSGYQWGSEWGSGVEGFFFF